MITLFLLLLFVYCYRPVIPVSNKIDYLLVEMAKKNQAHVFNTPDVVSSPSSFAANSPLSSSKALSGKALFTYGNRTNWTTSNRQTIKISQIRGQNKQLNKFGFEDQYLFDTLLAKCEIAVDRIFDIGQEICAKLIKDRPTEFNDELYKNLSHVDESSRNMIRCIGRICSDSDCQLDVNSTLLVGADEMTLRTVNLNFNKIKSFALFPGQTVLVEGTNPRGDVFYVEEIYSDVELTPSDPPKVLENLSIVMAAGPYTSPDDLSYEPLNEILIYCKQHKPDVLIIFGPFVDADHKCTQDGSIKKTFDEFFNDLMAGLMDAIGTDTEVVAVSSYKDAHSSFVYPTYAYSNQKTYPNLHFLPDPCNITINGVSIALSSTDILAHIQDNELALNAGDKIRRSFNYLLNQRSFYPLNPPPENVCIDSELAKNHAQLNFIPNIMIIPSTTKPFIREFNNCIVINPGHLTENAVRGTFGRFIISPTDDYKILKNYIAGQVIRI